MGMSLDELAMENDARRESLTGSCPLPFLEKGIAQIALIVENLDKSMESFWKLFGVGPWYVCTYGKPLVKEMSYRGQPADYKMRVALAWMGPLRLELIQILEGDTIYAEHVQRHS